MAVLTTSNLTDVQKTVYIRKLLEIARPNLVHKQFGQEDMVPQREGKVVQWFRFDKAGIAAETDYTTTDENPSWAPVTPTDALVTATLLPVFGKGYEVTEFKKATSYIDLLEGLRDILTQQAGEAIDKQVRTKIIAGTNVTYANAKTQRQQLISSDKIDLNDVLDSVVVLRNNDAKAVRNGGVDSGTFAAICSPNTEGQLMKDADFRTAVQFQKDSMFSGEIANLFGVRFIRTSLASTVSDSGSNNSVSTVEQTLIIGANAYGVSKILTKDFDVIYTAPGGHGDEYSVKHKITWKAYHIAQILNQSWMVRLETAR